MKDDYKVKVIREAIKNMQDDEYCLTRLRNDKGKAINLDIEVLKIIAKYYEGSINYDK